jgi:hypothetical protein
VFPLFSSYFFLLGFVCFLVPLYNRYVRRYVDTYIYVFCTEINNSAVCSV